MKHINRNMKQQWLVMKTRVSSLMKGGWQAMIYYNDNVQQWYDIQKQSIA